MPGPSKLRSQQERLDASHLAGAQDVGVRDPVLPLDTSDASQTAEMKLIKLADGAPVEGPGFTTV